MTCYTGINLSHTLDCPLNVSARLYCYCCGGTFPARWEAVWDEYGSMCFGCEGCGDRMCRERADMALDWEGK